MNDDRLDAAEADRVAAEIGRVEAEEERVDAEAGDGGHALELGRVQAEEGRVQAEEGRASAAKLAYLRIATLVAIPVVLISMIPWGFAYVLLDRADQRLSREIDRRCKESFVNRDAIRQSVIDGLPTIGYRYNPDDDTIVPSGKPPTISYYATHETERQDQLARSQAQLDRFPPIDC